MSIWIEIFLLGVGLSFDAMTAAITIGLCKENLKLRDGLKAAAFFGFFQGLMPLIGYFLGYGLREIIQPVDHWIALILLSFIGGKMLIEGLQELRSRASDEDFKCAAGVDPVSSKRLTVLAFATSVDALAAGISLYLMKVQILPSVLLIAATTFVLSLLGCFFGRKLGARFRSMATVIGGLILIAIGVKIVIDHITLGI